MADPVRHEDAGDAGGHGFFAIAGGQIGLAQEAAEEAVSLRLDVAPVDPGLDARAQGLLHSIHAADQGGEVRVALGVGPGDVACIAGELRAGVDQERVPLGWARRFQHLVVQDGATLIQGDDGVVGKVLLAQAAAGEEGELDLEFRGARLEGAGRGELAAGPEAARLAQAGELVGAISRPRKIEVPDEVWAVDVADAPGGEFLVRIAEEGGGAQVGGQKPARLIPVAAGADLEVSGPVALGSAGGLYQ